MRLVGTSGLRKMISNEQEESWNMAERDTCPIIDICLTGMATAATITTKNSTTLTVVNVRIGIKEGERK